VNRGLKQSEETKNYEPAIEGQVMILLDAFAYPELAQEGLMREVLNRVQRLRKRAGLVPTDDVKLAYAVLAPVGADGEVATEKSGDEAAAAEGTRLENERVIEEMFTQRAEAFTKAASKGVIKDDGSPAVLEEETDVKDVRLLLKLLKV
jgi:isoleucyl-tRNA synthetase